MFGSSFLFQLHINSAGQHLSILIALYAGFDAVFRLGVVA